eukprot:TRINITY_DN1838_c0_g1_i1.p1 TRINITY_DN1838_c0_g1~~TRINITY_DN1838_c0_g1_i1.p1  ORF type:complete len:460 (+),score=73.90 TRINITY_DN1838_c0_g1_i1:1268-2647(+)
MIKEENYDNEFEVVETTKQKSLNLEGPQGSLKFRVPFVSTTGGIVGWHNIRENKWFTCQNFSPNLFQPLGLFVRSIVKGQEQHAYRIITTEAPYSEVIVSDNEEDILYAWTEIIEEVMIPHLSILNEDEEHQVPEIMPYLFMAIQNSPDEGVDDKIQLVIQRIMKVRPEEKKLTTHISTSTDSPKKTTKQEHTTTNKDKEPVESTKKVQEPLLQVNHQEFEKKFESLNTLHYQVPGLPKMIMQKEAFLKWINHVLNGRSITDINDLSDGVLIVDLVKALTHKDFQEEGIQIPPNTQRDKITNIGTSVNYLAKVFNVPPPSLSIPLIVSKNTKALLELIWSLIDISYIQSITYLGLKGKVALMKWVHMHTSSARIPPIDNFSTSFVDGVAFCAIIHNFNPSIIDMESVPHNNGRDNLIHAFSAAKNYWDVPEILNPVEVRDNTDEFLIILYLAVCFQKMV